MSSMAALIRLGRLYCEATGVPASSLGAMACGNNRVFVRLFEGHRCRIDTAERVSEWLQAHWPLDVPWPADIPRPLRGRGARRCRRASVLPGGSGGHRIEP